jgi:actin related protein 2/3 complex subunit 4
MHRANILNILRKEPKKGFDISFLITNFHLENYKKEDIIDFIIEFIQDFSKEITDMKMTVNSQSRFVTTYLMEQLQI